MLEHLKVEKGMFDLLGLQYISWLVAHNVLVWVPMSMRSPIQTIRGLCWARHKPSFPTWTTWNFQEFLC